jgi:hypothetical protein
MRLRTRPSTVSPLAVPEIVLFPPEVDVSNAACFGVELLAAFRPGVAVVIADMTLTDFCDSSGIRHLLIANRRAKRCLVQLRVVVASDASPSLGCPCASAWPCTRASTRRRGTLSVGSSICRCFCG